MPADLDQRKLSPQYPTVAEQKRRLLLARLTWVRNLSIPIIVGAFACAIGGFHTGAAFLTLIGSLISFGITMTWIDNITEFRG